MKLQFPMALIGFLLAVSAFAADPERIDATSGERAEASFQRMLSAESGDKQQALVFAVVKINLVGVQSATELANNPALQSFGIGRIKDRVAGLTADEIIDLGEQVGTVKIERSGR